MSQSCESSIFDIEGVQLAAGAAGIRYQGRDDLVLVALAEGSHCAAVFTRNAFCAAPVTLAREHLTKATPRYWLINAGNANAGTGIHGLVVARETCRLVAEACSCALEEVLPFSTGVIGEDLPIEPFARTLPSLAAGLDSQGWSRAAAAIMTTDTCPKLASRTLELDGRQVRLTGMAKGSGMIHPDMATMLAYVATDAEISSELLQVCLQRAVDISFNAISVDGDTSTNDACVLAATGASGVAVTDLENEVGQAFFNALESLCQELARAIVLDGEGATKLVTIGVSEAMDVAEARQVAFTIAHSPLVKTALFASDPNWGRILAAVGRAGLKDLDIEQVRIDLDDVRIVSAGGRDSGYRESAGAAVMAQSAFSIRVFLGRGEAAAQVLTCDLSYDYVKINAEYRS